VSVFVCKKDEKTEGRSMCVRERVTVFACVWMCDLGIKIRVLIFRKNIILNPTIELIGRGALCDRYDRSMKEYAIGMTGV